MLPSSRVLASSSHKNNWILQKIINDDSFSNKTHQYGLSVTQFWGVGFIKCLFCLSTLGVHQTTTGWCRMCWEDILLFWAILYLEHRSHCISMSIAIISVSARESQDLLQKYLIKWKRFDISWVDLSTVLQLITQMPPSFIYHVFAQLSAQIRPSVTWYTYSQIENVDKSLDYRINPEFKQICYFLALFDKKVEVIIFLMGTSSTIYPTPNLLEFHTNWYSKLFE